jgi:glutathione synthase
MKVAFVIDKVEFKYFELNKLVTSFWLIHEFMQRGAEVCITTMERLYLDGNKPYAKLFRTELTNNDMRYNKKEFSACLNEFDMVLFRPDPPVNIEYIFATYVLDFVDRTTTVVANRPEGIRNANEKLYINNFYDLTPPSITTSNIDLIRDFVAEYGEAVLKPLNKCFGKGVYFLKKGDKNLNTILDSATNSGELTVIVQEFLKNGHHQDKRVIMIGGEVYEECITKLSGKEDFKFNTHRDEFFKKTVLTDKEREIANRISAKLMQDGLYLVGLDVMDEKLLEINVTSPCFFIKEINEMYGVNLEKRIVDYLETLADSRNYAVNNSKELVIA